MTRRPATRAFLGVLAAVFLLGLVAVAAAPQTVSRVVWRFLFTRSLDEQEARRRVAGVASQGGGEAPASLKVLRAEVRGGRDASYYFKAHVNPADLPAFKQSVAKGLAAVDPSRFSDGDEFYRLPLRVSSPRWWNPRELRDPDVVSGWEWVFVFSPDTGVIYAFRQDM